jgi:hypothetical protein
MHGRALRHTSGVINTEKRVKRVQKSSQGRALWSAKSGCEQSQQDSPLFDNLIGAASSIGGTSRPSALTVEFFAITRSNNVMSGIKPA